MIGNIPDLSMAISAIIACIQFALLAVSFAICWGIAKYLMRRSNADQPYEPSRNVRILLLCIAWAVTLVAGVILAGTGAFSGIFHYQVLDSRNITCIIAFFPDGLLQLTLGGGSWGKFLFDLGTGGRTTNCLDPQILSWGLERGRPFPLIFYIGVWLSYIGLVVGALTARQRKSFLVIFATLSLLLALNALGWQDYGSYLYGSYQVTPTPSASQSAFARGNSAMSAHDYDQAIAEFTKAIELNPGYVYAYNFRGNAYLKKGNFDQAIADYSKTIELDPKWDVAFSNRGEAYKNQGKLDQAIADYNKAIELGSIFAYYSRGLAYRQLGRKAEAIADFEKYLTLAPRTEFRSQVEQWLKELKAP